MGGGQRGETAQQSVYGSTRAAVKCRQFSYKTGGAIATVVAARRPALCLYRRCCVCMLRENLPHDGARMRGMRMDGSHHGRASHTRHQPLPPNTNPAAAALPPPAVRCAARPAIPFHACPAPGPLLRLLFAQASIGPLPCIHLAPDRFVPLPVSGVKPAGAAAADRGRPRRTCSS